MELNLYWAFIMAQIASEAPGFRLMELRVKWITLQMYACFYKIAKSCAIKKEAWCYGFRYMY